VVLGPFYQRVFNSSDGFLFVLAPAFGRIFERAVAQAGSISDRPQACVSNANAITYPECLHIKVEITYEPQWFRLRVRDDGRGIDSNPPRRAGPSWPLGHARNARTRAGLARNLRDEAVLEIGLKLN
jgi:hypothetical protein